MDEEKNSHGKYFFLESIFVEVGNLLQIINVSEKGTVYQKFFLNISFLGSFRKVSVVKRLVRY